MSKTPNTIRPNAGGTLAPDQIIGREQFIKDFWRFLGRRSVMILAPRRSGKTSVCRLAQARPHSGFIPFYRDLEGISRAVDFVNQLYRDVVDLLSQDQVFAVKARALYRKITGAVEVKGFKLELAEEDWSQLLEAVFTDLESWATVRERTVVLIWDEFPLFIRDVARSGHGREAMALLDLLRAIRARHQKIRMVFTGSIGLHEVIEELRKEGYGNDPTNDMQTMSLDVLKPEDAQLLVLLLVRGAGGTPTEEVVEGIAAMTEGHPFLIQHVVESLEPGGQFTVRDAEEAFEDLLSGATDPFELSHYIKRLSVVMGPEDERVAKHILDELATSAEGGLTMQELIDMWDGDAEAIRRVAQLLRRDGYVRRDDAKFRFARQYLHRYWKMERGL